MAFRVRIIGIGRMDTRLEEALHHYCKLLRPYATLSFDLIKSPAAGSGEIPVLRRREGEALMRHWPEGCHAVALSEEGALMDSKGFSRWLAARQAGGREVVFTIGGAYGLSEGLKQGCREVLSLSPLTLSHGIALLVVAEQIYRAFTILNSHPYHKD
jgi:23S rRNA (pseudouridine1915-N3)-methyltransferase